MRCRSSGQENFFFHGLFAQAGFKLAGKGCCGEYLQQGQCRGLRALLLVFPGCLFSCVLQVHAGCCWSSSVGRSDASGWDGFVERYFLSSHLFTTPDSCNLANENYTTTVRVCLRSMIPVFGWTFFALTLLSAICPASFVVTLQRPLEKITCKTEAGYSVAAAEGLGLWI